MYETLDYHNTVTKLRDYFHNEKGFIEVPTQSRLSILSACEEPKTVTEFDFDGVRWVLPQTGQMWLEYELLNNPDWEGVYCVSTSYRNEPNPIDGRHKKIFPMMEFEAKGDMSDLIKLEYELLEYLGFEDMPVEHTYDELCKLYDTKILEAEHEERMNDEIGNQIFLTHFPSRSFPFWNMKQDDADGDLYSKVDVILFGQETIGSAERSTSPDSMRENFLNQSGGSYSELLFDKFGKDRVMKELDDFLSLNFIKRFGAGIGVNRMARALKLEGLI